LWEKGGSKDGENTGKRKIARKMFKILFLPLPVKRVEGLRPSNSRKREYGTGLLNTIKLRVGRKGPRNTLPPPRENGVCN